MRLLITGATGTVGKEIVRQCLQNHYEIHYLTTSKSKIKSKPNFKGFYWNPQNNFIDESCLEGVDSIIHLAGATVSKRWTPAYKNQIIESRTHSTRLLVHTLGNTHENSIKSVVCASAIGIYPDSPINFFDETASKGEGHFLNEVVLRWEKEQDGFQEIGIPTAKVRIGLVLSQDGGALPAMVKPIRMGLGAAFGTGEQWQSWIHIEDLASIFLFLVNKREAGIFNAVAPNPVTQNKLILLIAQVLKKPLLLPNIPSFVLNVLFGEMAEVLLLSHRVSSKKIEDLGYHFNFTHLEQALLDLLEK